MKNLTAKVTCSICAKVLTGSAGLRPGWYVRKHKGANGATCWGHLRHDHRPVKS